VYFAALSCWLYRFFSSIHALTHTNVTYTKNVHRHIKIKNMDTETESDRGAQIHTRTAASFLRIAKSCKPISHPVFSFFERSALSSKDSNGKFCQPDVKNQHTNVNSNTLMLMRVRAHLAGMAIHRSINNSITAPSAEIAAGMTIAYSLLGNCTKLWVLVCS
jgi:hypothetical protein